MWHLLCDLGPFWRNRLGLKGDVERIDSGVEEITVGIQAFISDYPVLFQWFVRDARREDVVRQVGQICIIMYI